MTLPSISDSERHCPMCAGDLIPDEFSGDLTCFTCAVAWHDRTPAPILGHRPQCCELGDHTGECWP